MPIITSLDRHQMYFSSLQDKITADNEVRFIDALFKHKKKAVIVKLLLVYLKTTLRKLHNTLLATYGLTHLFYFICFGVQ